jgi:hypothetical protein
MTEKRTPEEIVKEIMDRVSPEEIAEAKRVTDAELPPEAEEILQELEEKQKKERETTAQKLIKIAVEKSYRDDEAKPEAGGLFHTPDRVAYADIEVFGWRETWPVRSKGFRHWLVRIFYETTGLAPNSEALQTALSLCEARAFYDGPERAVFTRVGGAKDLHRPGKRALPERQVRRRSRARTGVAACRHAGSRTVSGARTDG